VSKKKVKTFKGSLEIWSITIQEQIDNSLMMNPVKIGMTDGCFMTLKSEIKTTNIPNLQNFEIDLKNN